MAGTTLGLPYGLCSLILFGAAWRNSTYKASAMYNELVRSIEAGPSYLQISPACAVTQLRQ